LDGLTRSSKPQANPWARASVAVGLLAIAAIPAGIVLAREVSRVSLLDAGGAVPVAALLGGYAILLGRRARRQVERTIGRVGEARLASAGRVLGLLGLCLAFTAALALGFFGLLTLFAS
jgi:hypothetical protein